MLLATRITSTHSFQHRNPECKCLTATCGGSTTNIPAKHHVRYGFSLNLKRLLETCSSKFMTHLWTNSKIRKFDLHRHDLRLEPVCQPYLASAVLFSIIPQTIEVDLLTKINRGTNKSLLEDDLTNLHGKERSPVNQCGYSR